MEYELSGAVFHLMELVVPADNLPNRYDVSGLLRDWGDDFPPLKPLADCNFGDTYGQYFPPGSVPLTGMFYLIAQKVIVKVIVEIGKMAGDRVRQGVSLAPFHPAMMMNGNRDRLMDSLLIFAGALASRGVLSTAEVQSLGPQYKSFFATFVERWRAQKVPPIVGNLSGFWHGMSLKVRFPVVLRIFQILLVAMYRGLYVGRFDDLAIGCLSYNESFSAVSCVRSYFSHRAVSSCGFVTDAMVTGCIGAASKVSRLPTSDCVVRGLGLLSDLWMSCGRAMLDCYTLMACVLCILRLMHMCLSCWLQLLVPVVQDLLRLFLPPRGRVLVLKGRLELVVLILLLDLVREKDVRRLVF